MEEKRRDIGTLPPASSSAATATAVTTKSTEPASAEPASTRRRAGGQKRKANNGGNASSTPSKRLAREKASAPLPQIHNGPCTRARQSPNNLGAASGSVASGAAFSAAVSQKLVEPFAQSQSAAGGVIAAAEESKAASEDWQALEARVEAEYEVIRSRDANAHVVPIPSGWFSWAKVHPLEERALPSFFTGKSENRTADIYMEMRNWIMKKFHANPNTPIELKDLSELSVGELDARREVMEFLDYWGLINFHPFPSTDSDAANADSDGAAKTDPLVEKLYRFETVQSCPPVVPKTNLATPALPSRLFPESSIAEELVRPEGPAVEYHCNSCSADCSRKRYHCQKQADFDLCTECFNNGKFGSDMSPSDFILMEPAEVPGVSGGKWTDQETLLLLEALELYKENWNEIAEHVATKTKAQCILHFVEMPIEDMFLDHDNEIDASLQENADPVSTNNDLSVPKDAPETTESKTGVSEESKTGASEESKTGASEEKPMSSPMETSKPEDASEQKISQVAGENYALKALNEAFEVVGSLPTPGSQLSFAEVGNPVMALAAFLVRLVEADIASASTHSSLKSISGNSPGMQLAARHCFVLEHPPDEKKEPAGSERAVADMVDRDAQKDENQKEEICVSVLDGSVLNDQSDKKVEDSVLEEKEVLVSPNGECSDKSHAPKEPDAIATHEEVEPGILNEPNNPDLPKDLPPSIVKESDDLTSKAELSPSSAKESGNGTSEEVPAQCTEAPKDVDMVSDSLTEKKEPEQPVTSNSVVENEPNSGEDDAKDCKEENRDCTETNDNRHIDKIKRAAITAISAAAVKAKLLANQEEEQIRQLATLLIEKQLHKMETKLAFFTEMESVVMRVREQMDRSRQKLYHERAQIIATRLGFPASSSRTMPPSMPINRVATNFANSAPKPPMSMTSQRSPISRPIMTSALPTSNPFVSATVTGSSIRPSSQDKLSSVGTK